MGLNIDVRDAGSVAIEASYSSELSSKPMLSVSVLVLHRQFFVKMVAIDACPRVFLWFSEVSFQSGPQEYKIFSIIPCPTTRC